MTGKNRRVFRKTVVNACRFLLAATFIFSGFVKAIDPLGSAYKIEDYLTAFGIISWFPGFVPLLLGILLSSLEFFTGVCLLFGIRKTVSSTLALALMVVMTPLTLYIAIFNPVTDCGCFGDAWVLTNTETFLKNVVLLEAAIVVFMNKRQIVRFISVKMQWAASLYTLLFVFVLSFYCFAHLPLLDFRPYKIGRNITEGMAMPEGAKPDVFETYFTMEKDGRKQEFILENYPDSTWIFVDSRTVLKEKGYEPPIRDFSLQEWKTGKDITDDVLANESYTFLLVAHRLEEADDANIDLINEVYDYAVERGYHFYCLTSSTQEEIERWTERTGAEYPFCLVDDVTLRTMIRSNPGLILLKQGTIVNKWADTDIPDEYALNDKLENLPFANGAVRSQAAVIGYVLLWFFVPLLLVLGVDLLIARNREKKGQVEKETKEQGAEGAN
ncbi:MAG: DoxX family protein [Mediterranea sp.]|nr:DoxX family protein [Mediterranea sp.]